MTGRYRKVNFKRIVINFVNVKQPVFSYLLVFMFLGIEFCYVLMGGMFQVDYWCFDFHWDISIADVLWLLDCSVACLSR